MIRANVQQCGDWHGRESGSEVVHLGEMLTLLDSEPLHPDALVIDPSTAPPEEAAALIAPACS